MQRAMDGLARYLSPWTFKRAREQQRLDALRARDGDDCRRCRRPLRFDLPRGHDLGPKVEPIVPMTAKGPAPLEALCLCHARCNAAGADHTDEVQERVRRKSEAELFARKGARAA